MRLVHVVLFERPLIEEHVKPLTRGQLALGMLRIDTALTAAQMRFTPLFLKLLDDLQHQAESRERRNDQAAGKISAARAALKMSPKMNG